MSPHGGGAEREEAATNAERRLRGAWWAPRRGELNEEQRGDLLSQLFFEGPERAPFLTRFATLLALSILIAAFGLAADSAPVVIGAMLVSPLTTPLMGLSAALVLGWPRRQVQSLLILAVGTAGGIGLAWLAMWALPEPASVTERSAELLARTEPRLLDLGVAVVAGAAGAYVLVRREAVGALPGVAIAVALVPPLATVGMTLELGRADLADGALLLFVTNLAGIVLSGSLVMLILGVAPKPIAGRLPRSTRIGLAGATFAVLVVAYPLAEVTRQNVRDAGDRDDAERIAEEWANGTGLEISEVSAESDSVLYEVAGPRRPPPLEPLARELAHEFEEQVEVRVHWTREERHEATATP